MVFGPDVLIQKTGWYIGSMKTYYTLLNAGITIKLATLN